MNKVMAILTAAVLAACAIPAAAATGSSGWFFVDTTDTQLKISDVTSKYFDGEYGGKTGRKSTFLNGTSCEIEMKVVMDDYSEVDHWLVNGREVTARTFTVDVGTIAVGGKLEVVAIGKEAGVRSNTFRANFDIAEHVDENTPEVWTARPSNSEGIDEIRYTPFGAGSVRFPFAPEKGGKLPKQLTWLPGDGWALSPKIELKLEARSGGNGSFTFGTVGVGLSATDSVEKASHKRIPRGKGTLARVMDREVGISFTGGPMSMSWNPQKKKWVAEAVSFGGEVSGSYGMTRYFLTDVGPVFLEVKGELALASTFTVSGIDSALGGQGWSGLESSFTLSSECLPKVSVGGGYGINNVACLKGTLSAMSVLEATHSKGTWTDCRWGLRGSGALTAKFLPFEATLFEMTSQTYWIINNSSQNSMQLMSAMPAASLEWRLQPRDYLKDARPAVRLMSVPVGDGIAVVESGGYPDPAPTMASGVAGDAFAYLRDNAARSSANRTELVLRMGSSNEWGAAAAVWDDGTADFMPSLAAMPDGSVAAAWMNASRTFSDDVTIDEFCGATEIAVGIRNAATGAWTCRNLTSDGAFAFSPVVRAASNGKVLVAWLRNASGKMTSSAAEPTDIMAVVYSGGAWGGAMVVKSGVGIVNGFDVAYNGESAVLAYSKDADGDSATADDAEVYALRLDGGDWGGPVRLTSAGDADGMPLVRADSGAFSVLWTAKGALMETRELALSNAVAVVAADGWTLPANPTMIRGAGGRDALVWNGVSAAVGVADAPTAMMYDPVCGAWGSPIKLFDDGRHESRLSGAIGIDGGLRIGYESASVATNAVGEVSLGAPEVRTRFIPAVCDLAVLEDGFSFSTNELAIGEEVFLTVKAANLGFRPATNATVKVFEEKDGSKTELASIVTNFPGGGIVAVKVPWTVDNTQSNLLFTVEVDASDEAESAKGNNVYSWSAGEPDVSFGAVVVRNENAVRRLLTANVVNKGLGPLPAGAKVVFRRGGVNGEILAEDVVGAVWPGENGVYGAGFAWDIEGVAFTSSWETVCVQLYPEGAVGDALDAADTAFVQVMTTRGDEAPVVSTVTFDAQGGTAMETTRAVTNGCALGALPIATRHGYSLLGWFTAADGGEQATAGMVVVSNMTLYARWQGNFTFGEGGVWTEQPDGTWKSGVTADDSTNSISMTVSGSGTVAFRWKVSCEDYFVFRTQKILLDHLAFLVDGETQGLINGETDWTNATFTVEGTGEHALTWSYIKDSEGVAGSDCAWLDAVTWTPIADAGLAAWLAERNLTVESRAANGRTAAECYALGLDPTDATNDLRITSIELVDGKPEVEWEPKTNRWTGVEIQAVLKGAESLEGPWDEVPAGGNPAYRFFKVVVELP